MFKYPSWKLLLQLLFAIIVFGSSMYMVSDYDQETVWRIVFAVVSGLGIIDFTSKSFQLPLIIDECGIKISK